MRTRKLMTMHKVLYPRDDADRLCASRKEGGRWLSSSEDKVDASIQWFEDNIKKREGRLIWATRSNTDNTKSNKTEIIRKQKWEEKQLYRRFKRLTRDISHEKTWTWLRKGNLKKEIESIQIVAQINAIKTNHIKVRIDTTRQNRRCRLCRDMDKTINHIIRECSKFAQKTRHDWVEKVIHWELCETLKLDHTNKCTTKKLSWRIRRTNSSRILRNKQIT